MILIALAMILLKHGECALSLRDGKMYDIRANALIEIDN